MKLIPHFTFDGQSEEALNFYCNVLNGKITNLIRFSEMESCSCIGPDLKAEDKQRIVNACLQFGENMIYFCDQMPGQTPTVGNNIFIDIALSDEAELRRIFNALSDSGNVIVALIPTSWTSLYGMVVDRYGINWNLMQE